MIFDNLVILSIYKRASSKNRDVWSLAELQLTAQEYSECCKYANFMDKYEVIEYLNNSLFKREIAGLSKKISNEAIIGFFLLLVSAETIRREGRGKGLWSAVYKKFSKGAQEVLFPSNTQPSQQMKEAIEKAAKEFQLRHVFGVDGLKEWFDTVYLQIGFTRDGLINHLPEWLCRVEPVAIQYLLGKQGNIASENFKKLWITLKNFRNRNVTERYVRNQLHYNPWILPEWTDELIYSARKNISSSESRNQGDLSESEDNFSKPIPFLSRPLLRWKPPYPPEFFCEIQNLADLNLNKSDYDIRINSKLFKRLLRQEDGSYFCGETELVLSKPTAVAYTSLIDNDKNIVQDFSLQLWDSNEDLTIFDLKTGEQLHSIESQMFPNRSYALLLTDDLKVFPAINIFYKICNRKLYYLSDNWATTLEVPQIFWKPFCGIPRLNIDYSREITISCQPKEVKLGQSVTLHIKPKDIKILFIRVAIQPIDSDHRLLITPNLIYDIDHTTQMAKLKLKMGIRKNNKNYIADEVLTLKVVGAASYNEGQWEILNPHKLFTVEYAKWGRLQIFGVSGYLFEGKSLISEVQQKVGSIALTGLGNRLVIRQRNDENSDELMVLANEVVNTGVLESVNINRNILSLNLLRMIEPSAQHHILWVDSTGKIIWLTVDNYENNNGCLWQSEISLSNLTRPLLIGISYCGECLGSWWKNDWLTILEKIQEPEKIAYLIRWLKLPIFSSKYFQKVQEFADKYSQKILEQWFSSEGFTIEENYLTANDQELWYSVILEMFPAHPFTPAQRKQLLPKWLRPGTIIQHKEYGVGRFECVVEEGYLRIQYADSTIDVPMDSWKNCNVVNSNHPLDFQSHKKKRHSPKKKCY